VRLPYLAFSPYARKSLVCAHELGLDRELEVVSVETSPIRSSPEVNRANPLGKVPALLRDSGPDLFDSAVICEYFNSLVVGATLFPPTGEERWRSLRMHALADGLCDAAIAIRRERSRPPALRWPDWEQAHLRKLHQAYDLLESESLLQDEPVEIGQIALATALSWIEFRAAGDDFRRGRPCLTSWYDSFRRRPSMLAAAVAGA